jgi:hypothetical protein
MKKLNFLRFASALSLFAILFSSCTKDSLSKPSSEVSKNHSSNSGNTNDPIPGTGSVQAVLVSSTAYKTSLMAINEDNGTKYPEVFADQNGHVIIDNLEEGFYTIVAQAYIPVANNDPNSSTDNVNILSISTTNVKVVPDQITDLGTITFGQ